MDNVKVYHVSSGATIIGVCVGESEVLGMPALVIEKQSGREVEIVIHHIIAMEDYDPMYKAKMEEKHGSSRYA